MAPDATIRSTEPSPAERALAVLRLGLGVVWTLNLGFIVLPANQFFPTFAATAASYQGTTLGGPAFAGWVAAYPIPFAALIAGTTAYLAAALLSGVTVRAACVVGAVFTAALLVSQWGQTFVVPGGTDVGPQPIYLVAFTALALGESGALYSWAHLRRFVRARGLGLPAFRRPATAARTPPSLSPR